MPRRRRRPPSRRRLIVLAVVAAVAGGVWIYAARQPTGWQRVFATREGQIGDITATRMKIRPGSRFVALPHPRALGREVEIRYHDRVVTAPVLDVGPWNIDDAYWDRDDRPASERGHGYYRTPVNPAGIDLSDPVFAELGLRDNDFVEWRFTHRGFALRP